ncbi:hypothetical protein ACFXPV_23470 [Streptomyces sp. NPDC059118]|uniref:hypothetical protein n=1 Tax=unclassified Streptomyces TaxID=2593676 RepID=UPI0036C15473
MASDATAPLKEKAEADLTKAIDGLRNCLIHPVAYGLRTDHPVPGLPFIKDERLSLVIRT